MIPTATSKRARCEKCNYPQTTCLCAWIEVIDPPIEIVILQHPKEANHAKNTVKLLQLALTNLKVLQGESAEDFADFAKLVNSQAKNYVLCYPHENSTAIETLPHQGNHNQVALDGIILIDASWRKALKMWHLNPWLQQLKSWHFAAPPQNQYQIRQTKQANSLSTLESVAYLLKLTCDLDCTGLYQLFAQMQAQCFLNQQQKN